MTTKKRKAPALRPLEQVRREAFEGVEPDVELLGATVVTAEPPVEPAPPVNLGPCRVDGCAHPARVEVHWPAAKSELYCQEHAELALRGKVQR